MISNNLPRTSRTTRTAQSCLCGLCGSWLILLLVFCTAVSCKAEGFEKKELSIRKAGGGVVKVSAEIARTDTERSLGLMYRTSLADGHGMLFVYETEQPLSFWMMNTYIPLSIAFIASDGVILEIRDMKPRDTTSVRSLRPARYALEAPQGWFGRAGVAAGDIVSIPKEK